MFVFQRAVGGWTRGQKRRAGVVSRRDRTRVERRRARVVGSGDRTRERGKVGWF